MGNDELRSSFTCSLTIKAPCEAILDAFFDHEQLVKWWHISRSICTPRTFGCYAIEWDVTDWRDETLGRLGGIFHGTVVTFDSQREFFVADAYWLAPDGEPIGPMAFEVACTPSPDGTVVQVRQSGGDEGPRWSRYYDVLGAGLTVSLERMKKILENRWRP
jgi:uncharacterized protein YndB with AHSA1/START domain